MESEKLDVCAFKYWKAKEGMLEGNDKQTTSRLRMGARRREVWNCIRRGWRNEKKNEEEMTICKHNRTAGGFNYSNEERERKGEFWEAADWTANHSQPRNDSRTMESLLPWKRHHCECCFNLWKLVKLTRSLGSHLMLLRSQHESGPGLSPLAANKISSPVFFVTRRQDGFLILSAIWNYPPPPNPCRSCF